MDQLFTIGPSNLNYSGILLLSKHPSLVLNLQEMKQTQKQVTVTFSG